MTWYFWAFMAGWAWSMGLDEFFAWRRRRFERRQREQWAREDAEAKAK